LICHISIFDEVATYLIHIETIINTHWECPYRLPFTPPSLVRRIGPSIGFVVYLTMARNRKCLLVSLEEVNVIVELDEKLSSNFIS
jgi:hypothetical protein